MRYYFEVKLIVSGILISDRLVMVNVFVEVGMVWLRLLRLWI